MATNSPDAANRQHVALAFVAEDDAAVKNDCTVCPRCRAIRRGDV